MPPVRLSIADLRAHPDLLRGAAGAGGTVPAPQAGDPGAAGTPAGVRKARGGKGGRGSRFRLTRPEPDENTVLTSVLKALLNHPRVADAYRMNTGAGKLLFADGTSSRFIRFGKKGSPDIHGWLKDGTALFVETKRPSGKKRKEQVEWIERAKRDGCAAFFARRIEDVFGELGHP